MVLFLWMGFNCFKAAEPLWGDSLLFTTKFPENPGTHLIDLGRMKGLVDLEPPSGFEHGTPGLVIQGPNHQAITLWTDRALNTSFTLYSLFKYFNPNNCFLNLDSQKTFTLLYHFFELLLKVVKLSYFPQLLLKNIG